MPDVINQNACKSTTWTYKTPKKVLFYFISDDTVDDTVKRILSNLTLEKHGHKRSYSTILGTIKKFKIPFNELISIFNLDQSWIYNHPELLQLVVDALTTIFHKACTEDTFEIDDFLDPKKLTTKALSLLFDVMNPNDTDKRTFFHHADPKLLNMSWILTTTINKTSSEGLISQYKELSEAQNDDAKSMLLNGRENNYIAREDIIRALALCLDENNKKMVQQLLGLWFENDLEKADGLYATGFQFMTTCAKIAVVLEPGISENTMSLFYDKIERYEIKLQNELEAEAFVIDYNTLKTIVEEDIEFKVEYSLQHLHTLKYELDLEGALIVLSRENILDGFAIYRAIKGMRPKIESITCCCIPQCCFLCEYEYINVFVQM